MKRLKIIKISLFLLALVACPMGAGAVASAQSSGRTPLLAPAFASASKSQACQGLSVFGDQQCGQDSQGRLGQIVGNITNILSFIIGVIAIIMIIISGARFMTSGGDSSKVAAAKNALIFAIIGIVVVALAQIIVRYTVNRTMGGETSYSTRDFPAASKDKANCTPGTTATQIASGNNKGKWYCKE